MELVIRKADEWNIARFAIENFPELESQSRYTLDALRHSSAIRTILSK